MPYKTNEDLPDRVKNAIPSKNGKDIFRNVFNSQIKAGKTETVAFASAWSTLERNGYEKDKDGKYVKIEKRQIDVIADIPKSVRAKIPSKEGKHMWINAYNNSYLAGASNEVACAKAWSFLQAAGYTPDSDGEWISMAENVEEAFEDEASMFKRFCDWFKKAEYDGRDVELNKPFRTPGESKKFAVYVKNDKGNVVKVRFGDPNMEIKRDDPEARASFRARHSCDTATDKTSARYWSCRMWDDSKVGDVGKANGAKTLYVRRNVANAEEIIKWAKDNGFSETLTPDDLHVTIAFSKKPFNWENQNYIPYGNLVIKGGNRSVSSLGDKGAIVLKFESVDLVEEWANLRRCGASWDYESYTPHITLSYKGGPVNIEPFEGDIILGQQIYEEIKEDWEDTIIEKSEDDSFTIEADIMKFDEEQRLVYGWASIVEEDGKELVDKQGDIIETQDLINAAHEYMLESREAHERHAGVKKGETVESIVFTKDVQKALGIDLGKVGWFICQKIYDDETWEKVKSGELSAFSIGGRGERIPVE